MPFSRLFLFVLLVEFIMYCKCGCGEVTNVAPWNRPDRGWLKGVHKPYICGHSTKGKKSSRLGRPKNPNGNQIKQRRSITDAIKIERGCYFCDESDPCCLDFHHLIPTEKQHTIARMVTAAMPIEDILHEISKCIVLCSNCHRKYHAGRLTLDI